MDDLQANTDYNGYVATSPVIQMFWNVVRSIEPEDKALVLQFVTGTANFFFTIDG